MSTRADRIGPTGAVAKGQACPDCGAWVEMDLALHLLGHHTSFTIGDSLTDADIERIAQRVAQLLKGDPETALD